MNTADDPRIAHDPARMVHDPDLPGVDPALLGLLDSRDPALRLEAVQGLARMLKSGEARLPSPGRDVNNHIHTTYSFSPYTPSRAVWEALSAALATAGIMDHDTISGAREFLEAGRLLGLPVTAGAEIRVSFDGTPLAGRRINNPDQVSVAYLAFHGVPYTSIDALDRFLAPVRKARDARNREMAVRLDLLARRFGATLDYDRDVLPVSEAAHGGSVTERHLLFALVHVLMQVIPDRAELLRQLEANLAVRPSGRVAAVLMAPGNPYFDYDLLGLFKSELLPQFYLPAKAELLPVREALAFAEKHGIIAAYPYLGDVGESVTGDKKAQHFEDHYLEELFDVLVSLGIRAVTYMPSRNSHKQLARLRTMCRRRGFFEISGEDINQPRQPFVCAAMRKPEFSGLFDAAWALIGHERLAAVNPDNGMFTDATILRMPLLERRVTAYRQYAEQFFHRENKDRGGPEL